MKKALLSLLLICLLVAPCIAARAIDWTIRKDANAMTASPSSGIYKEVGSKTLYLTTSNTNGTFEVLFYQSGGTTVMSRETLTRNTAKTLLSPYFKIQTCSSEVNNVTAEVYILN